MATLVPGEWLRIYLCNPIASILTEMRHVMMDPHAAGAAEAIGGAEWLPIPLGIIAFVFARAASSSIARRRGSRNL